MSTLKVNRIEPRTGDTVEIVGLDIPEAPDYPIGQVRAWVNFNGTGTVAIRDSMNVSSITDNGVGDYTVNFTTAMPDANYATVALPGLGNGNATAGQSRITENRVQTTTNTSIHISNANSGGPLDVPYVAASVIR